MSSSQNEKIFKLETELQNLKIELGLVNTPKRSALIWRLLDGAVKYWTVLALLGIVVVQSLYGVPYFESIKNSSIRNDSSESFRQLGDNMMEHAEFVAAREAYTNSLLINPNNIDATHGLMKAEVLRPVGGEKRYAPVVVDAKLRFLKKLFEDDYILPYWEGVKLRNEGNLKGAKDCFQSSVWKNRNFIGGYLELGYTNLIAGDDIEIAIDNFSEALKIDPNYALANNSLGYCYMFKATMDPTNEQRVKESIALALKYLKKSDGITGYRPDTKLNLGDAYRYNGSKSYHAALTTHLNALELVEEVEKGKENSAHGNAYNEVQLTFPFIASVDGITNVRTYVQIFNSEQMKVFIFYALSFDYALLGELGLATESFKRGHDLDKRKEYGDYFAHRIQMIVSVLKPEREKRNWFAARLKDLLLLEDTESPDVQRKEKSK